MPGVVPTFYLYGEPHRHVDAAFIHVEPLQDRSRPSEWTIRPHAHAELNHVFLVSGGGGSMTSDAERFVFDAPVMIVVPARRVHAFDWTRESSGWVASIAQAELAALTAGDPDMTLLFASARAVPLGEAQAATAERRMRDLLRELAWSSPGRQAMLRSAVLDLLVTALRGLLVAAPSVTRPGRQAALVARFRSRVEERFRQREAISAHAAALGVSESTLRHACATVAGCSPAALIDERAMLEARRALLYSNLTVAEIGWSLGFQDPAYFTRFFTRHDHRSPRSFRRTIGASCCGAGDAE